MRPGEVPRAEREREIRAKVACDREAYDLQSRLIDGQAAEETMREAKRVLQPAHYADILEERTVDSQCGFPRCGNRLSKPVISKRQIHEVEGSSSRFCCAACARQSREFADSLSPVSLFLREGGPTRKAGSCADASATGAPVPARQPVPQPPSAPVRSNAKEPSLMATRVVEHADPTFLPLEANRPDRS